MFFKPDRRSYAGGQHIDPPLDRHSPAIGKPRKFEGIIPALESSHALAHALRLAPTLPSDAIIIVNLSGRGDKDVDQIERMVESGEVVPPTL